MNIKLKSTSFYGYRNSDLINLISLTGQYHRDRWTYSVGQYRNSVQPARAKTSSGALHKSMINSWPSGIPRFHGVFRVSISTNVNVGNTVIHYNKHTLDRNVQEYSGND